MNNNKLLLLTFDYEPYLGARSGTIEKCLLEPTHMVRQTLSRYHGKAIFFVDTMFLQTLETTPGLQSNYRQIKEQVKQLFDEGHYIFPHIHPHWLDAVYLQNEKQFDLSNLAKYSLSTVPMSVVEKLFFDAFETLRSMGISYKTWGYRAGGWCMQPFANYAAIFEKYSIRYDFSVLPGYRNTHPSQFFDYTMVRQTIPYNFKNKVEEEDENGQFREYPISTINLSGGVQLMDKLLRKYLWKAGDRGFGNGLSSQTAALASVYSGREMISIDILNRPKLMTYQKYLQQNAYMHWISHPKMFTNHSLKVFDRFLKFAQTNFRINYDFMEA